MSLEKEQSLANSASDTASDAIIFGGEDSLPPPPKLSKAEERKLWRKIDLRLLPIMALMYLLSFMDKGNIGNAKLQGLEKQLHLTGNRFNIALTMYFIPYCICECPANLVLKKFRPSRWLPGITFVWGIVMILMGLVKTYHQLVAVRAMLGLAEAGLFPGIVYYLSIWYPRYMLQYRIGLFFGAASLAGAFSGLLAYGISFMNGTQGLEAWCWIFILEGTATVVVAILAVLVMVDFPVTATFLTPEERAYVIWRKKYDNSSVGEEEHFEMRHAIAAITDWQVYVHILIYMSIAAPLSGITFFLPTIIHAFGYSTTISQLLSVPPYVCATILIFVVAHYSDKLKMRSPFILGGLTMCLIGFSINIFNVSNGAKYFGTFFCVGGSYATVPGILAWLGNNLSGQYKRGVGLAIQVGIGTFSAAMACNFYRSEDAPRFIFGHALEMMFVGIGLIMVPITAFSYVRINAKRDAAERAATESGQSPKYTPRQLQMFGDRAPDFRYTL